MIVGHIGGAGAPYEIQKSLRFRASASAYLSRTFSTSSLGVSFSFWIKRGAIGSAQSIFVYSNGSTESFGIGFNADNTLDFYSYSSAYIARRNTTRIFRDPSAWYHIMLVVDSANVTALDRMRVYVNGVRETAFNATVNQAQNQHLNLTQTWPWSIGRSGGTANQYLDGYVSEYNFIDGQALDPSYFGEVSAETGAWIPKKYTGTYGTHGFYLPFNDGSSLANLTADKSGNGNNWTANNISLTSGSSYDWMDDTPTNNFAVLNAVHAGRSTISNANLTASGTTDLPTIIPDSGTWYFERSGSSQTWVPPAAFPSGSGDYNFGQRPWQSTGPTGGQKALCTKNLPTGTITTSGTFSGNASTDGPFVYLNGVPTAMTINGNAVTFGNHADKLANGFKVRSSSASYNSAGSNTYSITSTGTKFKYSNAQGNP
jgi:hypothetical protein